MASTKAPPARRPPPSGPEGRGYVSPLGGQTAPFATNLQRTEERRNRAQSARRGRLGPEDKNHAERGKPGYAGSEDPLDKVDDLPQ
jgi:hypothetical protein